MRNLTFFLALITTITAPTLAHAEDQITLSAGAFDFAQQDDNAALLGIEYRFDDIYHGLRPVVGAFGTGDASAYGYGGFQWDAYLTNHLVIAPQLAVGLYSKGAGKDLFHAIEFRSGIELGYEFEDNTRLSLGVAHLSNASLGDDNPGTEALTVNYSFAVK